MSELKDCKVVIFAGGKGTRIAEESATRPKPMVEIGGKPILWHIMKIYAAHGLRDFVICLGYKGMQIKEYFFHYGMLNSDLTVELRSGHTVHENKAEDWRVTLVDTGEDTMTGGRLKRVAHHLPEDQPFLLTYGDGVSDVDITALYAFHQKHGKLATVTGVKPNARFGALHLEGDLATRFQEKPESEGGYINGGFFVCSPRAIELVKGDETLWEKEPLETLASTRQLGAYLHDGFWQPMDTLRDRQHLEELWEKKKAPWKVW